MPDQHPLNLVQIRRDGGTQPRATLNTETVRDYAEAMARGEQFPPVIVFYDGSQYWLADGFHRVQAAQDAGHAEIDAEVRQGTQRDAVLSSVAANAKHGLPRCAEDKRRAVLRLLEDDEWSLWSDRKIAEATHTSHPFVGKLRKEIFGDDMPAERAVERDGQQYTMSTDGINDGREASIHKLANEYTARILEMLPDGGMLYTTIRNKLGVKQSNKTQMDAFQHALDTLFGQQKLAKKHGQYVLAETHEPDAGSGDDDDHAEPIDYIDPITAEVTQVSPATASPVVEELNAKFNKDAITLLNRVDNGAWHRAIEVARKLVAAGIWNGEDPIEFDAYLLHDKLFGVNPVEPDVLWREYQIAHNDGDPIDLPATDEQPQPDQAVPAPDAKIRTWLREQLRDGQRHYNILSRVARTEGIPMKDFLRVIRAMLDDGELELDGQMYGLAGDTQERPMLPDELDDDDKAAIRDALVAAVRDEALISTQINTTIHAITGKKLDILYLISWLDMLARDGYLIKTTEDGHMPTYQLNPNPPTKEDVQQRRQAADIETRLGIVRRAIADKPPQEHITVTWLKRAAPAAVANAAEAGDLLTRLVDLDELRIINEGGHYELVEAGGAAESIDPGQDGEAVVEPAGEPRNRAEQLLAALVDRGELRLAPGKAYFELVEANPTAESIDPGQDGDGATERADEPRGRAEQPPAAVSAPDPGAPLGPSEEGTALLMSAQLTSALFNLDDAFKAVRVIKSIQTWHQLEPHKIERLRQAITMARAWMYDLDGFLEDFDDALASIIETGEPYLDLIEIKPLEDDQAEAVQA